MIGLTLLIMDMALNLRLMPAGYWRAPSEVPSPGTFNLRMMIICPGPIGWLGGWCYIASLIWWPCASWRAFRTMRSDTPIPAQERALLMLVAIQIVVVQVLLRATPLKYGYPLF